MAPILIRHRGAPIVQGLVKGAYAAAIGTILGAAVLLGKIAIGDWLRAGVAALSLLALARWKVSNPVLVAKSVIAAAYLQRPPAMPSWCGWRICSTRLQSTAFDGERKAP